jgi:hypothetical protein
MAHTTRKHVDGAAIIRLVRPLHDAGLLLELPAYFDNNSLRRTAHSGHGDAAKEIWQQSAEQEPDDDIGIG